MMIGYKFSTALLFLYFTCQINCLNYLHNYTYHCKNGGYVSENAFCSQFTWCGDNSDRSYGCNQTKCKRRFTCKDGSCVGVKDICNTIKNCPDGSDEENCGENVILNNCTLGNGKFLCKDKLRCLDIKHTCDSLCNCFDCSDEDDNCLKYDDDLQRKCRHAYFSTLDGPQCYCNFSNSEYSAICKEIKSCSGCKDQKCIEFKSKTQCICKEDYHILKGGPKQSCKSYAWYEGIIYYVNDTNVVSLNMTSKEISLVQEIINCTAITVANSHLYMAQFLHGKGHIFKKALDSEESDRLVEIDALIVSVSVDYITNNVYFATNKSLSVCTSDGRICTMLKCCNVRNVVVAPRFGLMYFNQEFGSRNELIIKKSNLDGTKESIMKDEIFHSAISIEVDEISETLYFAELSEDGRKTGVVSFNGDYEWNGYDSLLRYQSSMSSFEGTLFYSAKNSNIIRQMESWYESVGEIYFEDDQSISIKHLHAYNPFRERFNKTENPCLKAVCSGICLLSPEEAPNSGLSYTCINELRPLIENATEEEEEEAEEEYYLEKEQLTHTSDSNTTVEIVLLILIVVVLFIGGYFVIKKFNLTQYYTTCR